MHDENFILSKSGLATFVRFIEKNSLSVELAVFINHDEVCESAQTSGFKTLYFRRRKRLTRNKQGTDLAACLW